MYAHVWARGSEALVWFRGRVCDVRCSDYGYEVKIAYGGKVLGYDYRHGRESVLDYSGTTCWMPLTSPNIDFENYDFDYRLNYQNTCDPELSKHEFESACLEATAWNPHSRIELCEQVLRGGEDRFNRSIKSRRKKKTGKGRGKKERSNADALRSLRRIRRKRKKYVKSITHRV